MRRYSLFARTSVCLAKETGTPINKAASSPASKTAPQAASRSESAPHKYSKDVSLDTTPVWRKGGESAVVTDAITTSRRVQMYQGGKAPRDYLSGPTDPTSAPKEDDPTTWPKEWDATAIEEFLSGKLNEGANVDFEVLAFCLQKGNFDTLKKMYLDQLAPQKYLTVRDLLVHMSQPIFHGRFNLLTSDENLGTITSRSTNIRFDEYLEPVLDVRAQLYVLHIATCESGGGKTVSAVAAVSGDIVFYFLATDIHAGFNDPTLSIEQSRQRVVTNLVAAMEAVFAGKGHPGYLEKLRNTDERITLGIVVDEAGADPSVVRALCGVITNLRQGLQLPVCVTVLVAVAGTGVGCGSIPPGSLPTAYSIHHVATGEHVWKNLTKKSECYHALIKPIEAHARGSLVIKNPRFARLLYAEIQEAMEVTSGLPGGSAATLVESCLVNAAIKFKRINGLNGLKGDQLLHVVGAAVAAIQTHNTPPVPCPSFSDTSDVMHNDLAKYIRTYGMVVDNAGWSPESTTDVWGQMRVYDPKVCANVVAYLVSPPGARYTLSVSQSAIFLLLLGLVPARSELSGETLESAVTTLFPLLISAHRGRTVGDMLSVFVGKGKWTDKTVLQTGVSPLGVQVVRYNGTGQGVLEDIAPPSDDDPVSKVDRSQACVIVSGPKYPFADIVVAIPNAALILVQCKDYATQLSEAVILEELYKMGHPQGTAPLVIPPPRKTRTLTRTADECEKIRAENVAKQDAQYRYKQKQMQLLASAFNVPKVNGEHRITYLFIESKAPPKPHTTHKNVCFGAIDNLPTPLAEMIPFNTQKVGGPPTINNVGRLPQKLFASIPPSPASDTPTPANTQDTTTT